MIPLNDNIIVEPEKTQGVLVMSSKDYLTAKVLAVSDGFIDQGLEMPDLKVNDRILCTFIREFEVDNKKVHVVKISDIIIRISGG